MCAMTGTNASMFRVIEKDTAIAGMTIVTMVTEAGAMIMGTEVTAITVKV
ncbi:hypothetical protein [Sulfuricurvum sp.]|nr:hypothetical protein [Sulfuricurvum sp.]